jgi:ATP-dependent helicase HrpA
VAEIEPMWIEAAVPHLLKREYLEPDWDEAREQVVARERIGFLGLILSANRIVNYGPIAPEEARLIFAREALVYRRLQRRPEWLARNDAALDAAQEVEERLRTRDLLRPAEYFVEFYDRALPRQVSSTATLEYFTRNLTDEQRASLSLGPGDVFARVPDSALLEQFPTRVAVAVPGGAGIDVTVDYRFTPGETGDGATLRIPLLALPTLTRASVDAVVAGLAAPCVEALLRSLPKDARRSLIPIASAAAEFIRFVGAPSTDTGRLASWLQQSKGVPSSLVRFDLSAVPPHLQARLSVSGADVDAAPAGEAPARRILAQGRDLAALRRRCAAAARTELDRRARAGYPAPWRRFEAESLDLAVNLDTDGGAVVVFTALAPASAGAAVRFEWSEPEARRLHGWGCVSLARQVLDRQDRDLARTLTGDGRLLLAASPYLRGEELAERLLRVTFWRACFAEAEAPRTRAAFDAAVESGRGGLYPAFDAVIADAAVWFAEARRVRGLLDDPRSRPHSLLAEATQAHLERLLGPHLTLYESTYNMRQLPRYLKAERRRWERLLERGSESPQIAREALEWQGRAASLGGQLDAERRWLPQYEDFCVAIEEYRVSLYAQELRGAGAVSAARLATRAAEIDAWLTR